MDKRNQLKPKKQKESKAPHIERQKSAQMQAGAPLPQQPQSASPPSAHSWEQTR